MPPGPANVIYYTDAAWAPMVHALDFATGANLGATDLHGDGIGDLALTKDGKNMFVWRQYGWRVGVLGSWVARLDASTPAFIVADKIEREHQFWQGRLPPYFASEEITDVETANPQIEALRPPSQCPRDSSRTTDDPSTRLGFRGEGKALHSSSSPTMPLVALRLERPFYD